MEQTCLGELIEGTLTVDHDLARHHVRWLHSMAFFSGELPVKSGSNQAFGGFESL